MHIYSYESVNFTCNISHTTYFASKMGGKCKICDEIKIQFTRSYEKFTCRTCGQMINNEKLQIHIKNVHLNLLLSSCKLESVNVTLNT